ncbi:hypothetical protein [Glycomyces tenuis]|uniref:hypothetical protein n=1 Tax=Glycomyces tenuis TaxID=58116 RepID=UPI00041A0AF5|nr:hypothetical protein [Glycomyces tenuis]
MTSPHDNPEPVQTTGPPRWVKIAAVVTVAVIALVVVALLVGGGDHGPSRHGIGSTAENVATH